MKKKLKKQKTNAAYLEWQSQWTRRSLPSESKTNAGNIGLVGREWLIGSEWEVKECWQERMSKWWYMVEREW